MILRLFHYSMFGVIGASLGIAGISYDTYVFWFILSASVIIGITGRFN